MLSKVLVLGGSYLQSDFIFTALKCGCEVHVLDRDRNCFISKNDDIVFEAIDISDVAKVNAYFVENSMDLILSPVTEIGNRTASIIAGMHGVLYNSSETVLASTDKKLMRKTLESSRLQEPDVIVLNPASISEEELNVKFPVIVKPAISSASRGVTLATNRSELNDAIKRALPYCSNDASILVEEYLPGDQFSIETITFNGEHRVVAIVKEELSGPPYFMERTNIIDLEINKRLAKSVGLFVNELLNKINVQVGPSHIEVKIFRDEIRLIEVATRSGLLRDRLIKAAKGPDYNELILKSYLGADSKTQIQQLKNNSLLGIVAYKSDLRMFESLRDSKLLIDYYFNGKKPVQYPKMLTDAIGYFFLSGEKLEQLYEYQVKM
jgi:phosphoribosylaminoimidazole carboxylase (NCAIR synthetase)